jgi:hypothetical protein
LRGQVVAGSRNEERSRKRKRRADSDELNPRRRPRPRLQTTYGISDLQKISQEPTIRRKSIRQVCELYDLELDQLMQEVKRCAYLTNLPIFVDEFTDIDTWDTLRSHLHSTAYRSATKMQRICAKPAARNSPAKNDPVLYVGPGQAGEAAKLHGKYEYPTDTKPTKQELTYGRLLDWPSSTHLSIDPDNSGPESAADGLPPCVQQNPAVRVQNNRLVESEETRWAKAA